MSSTQTLDESLHTLSLTIPDLTLRTQFLSQMQSFKRIYDRYQNTLKNSEHELQWDRIEPLSSKQLIPMEQITGSSAPLSQEKITSLLSQLVVLKLNGGLGTSMGCHGPKSVIEVRNGNSFLDLAVKQVEYLNNKYNVDVPLVLMNSFNTEHDTQQIIKKYAQSNVRILCFQQKQYPRIRTDDGLPYPTNANPDTLDPLEWFPPGHGDVYDSFVSSPLFSQLRSEGKTYLFFSNVDNLGATVDTDILNYLIENKVDFCMEVTPKTAADVKGGTLIQYDKQVKLLEIAQVPKAHLNDFQDIEKFTIFNTNNLWANLEAIKAKLDKLDQIELIINQKEYNGVSVLQLETAAGAAIQMFDNAIGMVVPRSRFLPVKKSSDLLLIKSNIYTLGENFSLERDEQRKQEDNPIIDLDTRFYTNVDDFLKRFPHIPDILHLDLLEVRGDVRFEQNVHMSGKVLLLNDAEGKQLVIRDQKFNC